MRAASGQADATGLRALLREGTLAGEWVLDAGASSVRLKSRSMGLIVVNGVFREVTGKGSVSADGRVSGSVRIAAASIDTKNARRDEHLRSADFFGSDDNPDITFTANGIRPSSGGEASGGAAVDGTLTVRGNSRPLSFEAAVSAHGDAAPSGHRVSEIWLDAEVRVNRADFGLTWNVLGMVSLTSVITVHAVFIR